MNHLKPKRIVICLALIGASTLLSSAQAALLFSQYVDGNNNKKGLEIYNRFLYEHEPCGKDIIVVKKGDTFLIECPVCKQQVIMPPNSVIEESNINNEIFKKYGILIKEIR